MSVIGPIAAKKLQGQECREVPDRTQALQENSLFIRSSRPHRRTPAIRGTGGYGILGRERPYSALMLAALITLTHFSVSSAISLPKSAGEPPRILPPRSAMRAFSFASASAALISLFSLSTMSAGVLRGAATPYQELASKPGRNSLIAGPSGKPPQRAALVTASASTLPVLTYSTVPGALPNRTCTCPPSRSVKAGAIPR